MFILLVVYGLVHRGDCINCETCDRACVPACVRACECVCVSGEMSVSLCLCKRSGLLRDGAP